MAKKQKMQRKRRLHCLPSTYEMALLQAVQSGDQQALQLLIANNLWFTKRLVKVFTPKRARDTSLSM